MTKSFRMFLAAAGGLLLCSAICLGEEDEAVGLKLSPSGFAALEFGEIVKGGLNKKTNAPMDGTWMNQMIAGLSVDAAFNERNPPAQIEGIGLEHVFIFAAQFPLALWVGILVACEGRHAEMDEHPELLRHVTGLHLGGRIGLCGETPYCRPSRIGSAYALKKQ